MQQGIWNKEEGPIGLTGDTGATGPAGPVFDGSTPLDELTVNGISDLNGITTTDGLVRTTISQAYQAGVLGFTDTNNGFLFRPPRVGNQQAHLFETFAGADILSLKEDLSANFKGNIVQTSGVISARSGENTLHTFGRAFLGGVAGVASFSNLLFTDITEVANTQDNNGTTSINAKTGQNIVFKKNNSLVGKITDAAFEFGLSVKMTALPTSDPVSAGALWNDSGTVKISAG
jgi:hypothetical protein